MRHSGVRPGRGAGGARAVCDLDSRALAAIAAGSGQGFVLDREGHVIRVASDGSLELTASVGPYSTPFGTAVDGHAVFGGIRCGGSGCRNRLAELAILDADGRLDTAIIVRSTAGWPSKLDGMALVGRDQDTVWVNAGGTLFQVAVSPAAVIAEVAWPGGEPCVIGGVLHDLTASGGSYDQQGAALNPKKTFELQLSDWDGDRWRPVEDGATAMPFGQNAYCSPGGYEIRDSQAMVARWEPGSPWQMVVPPGPGWDSDSSAVAPVTTSSRARYVVDADGSLLEISGTDPPRRTGVEIPEFRASDMPPAVQVDEADGRLFWCATTYRAGAATTRCAVAPDEHRRAEPVAFVRHQSDPQPPTPTATPTLTTAHAAVPTTVHHYNLCSAVCGNGVRSHSRDVVTWFVQRHRPAALSLNEICYDDGVHLAGRLPGFEMGASYTALHTATNCPGVIKRFGNQVLVQSRLAPRSGSWAQFPTQTSEPCDHRRHECRGIACVDAHDDGQRLVFCSAHLESPRRGPSVAASQASEYRELVSDRYGDESVIVLAGDFNLPRHDADAVLVPRGYRAATTGPSIDGPHPPASRQIDMVYVDGPGRTAGSTGTTYCDVQASDHCYLVASWAAVDRVL